MSDLHDMAADLSRVASADYQPLLRQVGQVALKFIDARTPYKTGQLVRGNRFNVISSNEIEFSNAVDYAAWVHNGTDPHVIRPKNSPVLVFEVNGQTIITSKPVNHPGTKAQPFIENGINDAIPAMEQLGVQYLTTRKG